MADSTPSAWTSILGTGWSFPPEFVRPTDPDAEAGVRMTSDEEDIEASLRILLSTGLGERFLQPKYGLDLRDQVFEAMSRTAQSYLEDRVRSAILIYEPRIELQDLKLDFSKRLEGTVLLQVEYRVRTTNSRYNLVFPFYQSGDAIELRSRIPARRPPAA